MIKLKRLDRRMNGYQNYTHRVDITGGYSDVAVTLQRCREGLWEHFGPGCELIIAQRRKIKGIEMPEWCWDTEHGNVRLYIKDPALTQFVLMKSKFEEE